MLGSYESSYIGQWKRSFAYVQPVLCVRRYTRAVESEDIIAVDSKSLNRKER